MEPEVKKLTQMQIEYREDPVSEAAIELLSVRVVEFHLDADVSIDEVLFAIQGAVYP